MTVAITTATALSSAQADAVASVARDAEQVDGVGAISEAFQLALRSPESGVTHVLAYAADSPSAAGAGEPVGETLAAYAALDPSAAAELVVHPTFRRRGVGSAVLDALLGVGGRGVWAHGDLPGARALATSRGMVVTRELHLMSRPLSPDDRAEVAVPQGFSARAFKPGRDEQAWLDINAAAFAHHPEQGSITIDGLRERMAQPWFDPRGFILVEDTTVTDETGSHPLAAFHWTKVEAPAPEPGHPPGPGAEGEVYVVGVHPAYQGRGLGKPTTALGLRHLASLDLSTVKLYVDGDNDAALATYRGLGFTDAAVDVVWSLPPQS